MTLVFWIHQDRTSKSKGYLLQSESCSVMSNSLWPHALYSPWNSPGQNTGVGSLALLQGIFPTQGSIPGLPHRRQFLYQLSHKGSPRILEWVAYPFSSRSSWPRNWTRVSCIAGGFFTNWAIREAQNTGVGSHAILLGSSQPKDWTQVSRIAGEFFYHLSQSLAFNMMHSA